MLTIGVNAEPFRDILGEACELIGGAGRIGSFDIPCGCARTRYEYRTGFPSIDCLRSVSGVHRARMERRLVG